jgi:hypothetical protein
MKGVYYAQAEITRSGSSEGGSSVRIAPVWTEPENTNQLHVSRNGTGGESVNPGCAVWVNAEFPRL